MHIIDVFGGEKLPVSFEIFPPKGDLPVEEAREVIGGLAPLSPSFVSVTYSAGGSGNSSRTIDVAKMAQDEYGLNMMAHLTCMNADRAGIDSVLASMKAAGIENVRRELAVAHHQAARALRRRPESAAPGGHRLCVPAVRGPLEGRR